MKPSVLCVAGLLMLMPYRVIGQTCDAGTYLGDDGATCLPCNPAQEAFYCPGDGIRHPCPKPGIDYVSLAWPDTVTSAAEGTWAIIGARSATQCYGWIKLSTPEGNLYNAECAWNGDNYYYPCNVPYLWYFAAAGYYLAPYRYTTGVNNWYDGVKRCTNAPAHAHYTASGTPDDPVAGGKTDYNDCPWECDCGYVKSGQTCIAAGACTAGVNVLRTGSGVSVKLYKSQTTSPTVVVSNNGQRCYACLATGGASDAINIQYVGVTYHTVSE